MVFYGFLCFLMFFLFFMFFVLVFIVVAKEINARQSPPSYKKSKFLLKRVSLIQFTLAESTSFWKVPMLHNSGWQAERVDAEAVVFEGQYESRFAYDFL